MRRHEDASLAQNGLEKQRQYMLKDADLNRKFLFEDLKLLDPTVCKVRSSL